MGSRQRTAGVARTAEEYDQVSGWKRVLSCFQRPGFAHRIKTRMARRERHNTRQQIRQGRYP